MRRSLHASSSCSEGAGAFESPLMQPTGVVDLSEFLSPPKVELRPVSLSPTVYSVRSVPLYVEAERPEPLSSHDETDDGHVVSNLYPGVVEDRPRRSRSPSTMEESRRTSGENLDEKWPSPIEKNVAKADAENAKAAMWLSNDVSRQILPGPTLKDRLATREERLEAMSCALQTRLAPLPSEDCVSEEAEQGIENKRLEAQLSILEDRLDAMRCVLQTQFSHTVALSFQESSRDSKSSDDSEEAGERVHLVGEIQQQIMDIQLQLKLLEELKRTTGKFFLAVWCFFVMFLIAFEGGPIALGFYQINDHQLYHLFFNTMLSFFGLIALSLLFCTVGHFHCRI